MAPETNLETSTCAASGARAGAEARAQRLLAEYLRTWGLRDPATIAVLCRRWVRRTGRQASTGALFRAAIQHAIHDIDAWLDQIAHSVNTGLDNVESCRGLLAIEVQASIDKHPETLRTSDSWSPAFLQACSRAARPVVPADRPALMPAHPLGILPPVLSVDWWTSGISWLTSVATSGMTPFRRCK